MLKITLENNDNSIRIDDFFKKVEDVYHKEFPMGFCKFEECVDDGISYELVDLYFDDHFNISDIFNIRVEFKFNVLSELPPEPSYFSQTRLDPTYLVSTEDCCMTIKNNGNVESYGQSWIVGTDEYKSRKKIPVETVVDHRTYGDMEEILDEFYEYVTDIKIQVEDLYKKKRLRQQDISDFDVPKRLGLR